ncbi:MAG: hypothetical protein JNM76_00530 [Betaproteobacteria bacterium]|nr:hypothetical protein [Betaproteobacteria bacterium]
MTAEQLRETLLIEAHRLVSNAANSALRKLGQTVPLAAVSGYVTDSEIEQAKDAGFAALENPAVQKIMEAGIARASTLAYPPNGEITRADAEALESLKLSEAQRQVLTRLIQESVHAAFFHFFALMDGVGDPIIAPDQTWRGAEFNTPRSEGPMLHDDFGDAYYRYIQTIRNRSTN